MKSDAKWTDPEVGEVRIEKRGDELRLMDANGLVPHLIAMEVMARRIGALPSYPTQLERWRMVPDEPESEPIPHVDFAPDGRQVVTAVIRGGGPRLSTVVTSERLVGEIDVVGRCLLVDDDGDVLVRDGHPLALKVRLSEDSRDGRQVAGCMATATVFPSGESIAFQGCAVALDPDRFAEGCIQLGRSRWADFLSPAEVEALADPWGWSLARVEFLRGLLRFDLQEVLNASP